MMKKMTALLLACTLLLAGCGKSKDATTGGGDDTKVFKIGIAQFVQHNALDQAREGFIAGLEAKGYVDGDNIQIDYQNAQGEMANTGVNATKLVNAQSDLILAIGTPSAQAVVNNTDSIPVVFTAITDPVDAQLVDSVEQPGGNVTGVSDMAPIAEQIDLLMKFAPDAKTIGIMFCSNEANSRIQADLAIEAIEGMGLEAKEYTVSESNQIRQVAETAAGQVDALYTPTDNMIAAGMTIVATIAMEHQIPHVGGEVGQVENGALATVGVDYYKLGQLAAEQAIRILEGADPATMPVEFQTEFDLSVNEDTLKTIGLTMPEGLE